MKKYDGFNCFFAKLGKIEDVENMDNCSKKMLDERREGGTFEGRDLTGRRRWTFHTLKRRMEEVI